jgi:hypothetical protein
LIAIGFSLLAEPRAGRWAAAASGAAFALAASVEISFTIFLVLAPMLLVRHGLRRTLPPFLAAAAPFVVAYFAFNLHLSGSAIPPAMNAALWNYPGSEFNDKSLTGLATHSSIGDLAVYTVNMLAGSRGLFTFTPILLLSVYGLVRGMRTAPEHRTELAYIGICCAAYVGAFILTSNNYSGWSYGVRWYAGIAYLAAVPLGFIGEQIKRSAWWRGAFIALAFASIVVAVVGLADPAPNPQAPAFFENANLLRHDSRKSLMCTFFVLATTVLLARLAGLTALPQNARADAIAVSTDRS